jgi:hypothetical protein
VTGRSRLAAISVEPQSNRALHVIVSWRMLHDHKTRAYLQRRRTEQKTEFPHQERSRDDRHAADAAVCGGAKGM